MTDFLQETQINCKKWVLSFKKLVPLLIGSGLHILKEDNSSGPMLPMV